MIVAVNGKSLGIAEKGGAVRVAVNLLRELATRRPGDRFRIYLPLPPDGNLPDLALPDNVSLRADRAALYAKGIGRSLWEQFVLPSRVRRDGGAEIMLNLTNSAPVLGSPGTKQLLLLHDVGFLNRDWFSGAYSRYLTLLVRLAIARGVHFATVSETSAQQIREAFPHVGPVAAIANGVDAAPPGVEATDPGFRYALYLGSLNPRKNFHGAIAGYRCYRAAAAAPVKLVVVGGEKAIFTAADTGAADDDIHFKGYVDDDMKWRLLKGADALLLPSFLEGFGLPVLEAMQLEVPVIASDIPVFRELFDGAVEFVDPHDASDIGRGLAAVLDQPERAAALAASGPGLAARFTWAEAGQAYSRLIDTIVGSGACAPVSPPLVNGQA